MKITNPGVGLLPGEVKVTTPQGATTVFKATADTNAARGTAVTNAKTAAVSGDLISVGTGTFEAKNLFKTGVNWHLSAGTILLNSTDAAVGVFDDSSAGANGAIVCTISGSGQIKHTAGGLHGAIYITNAGSVVDTAADLLSTTDATCLYQSNGSSSTRVRSISSTAGAGVWWDGVCGPMFVEAEDITASTNAIYSSPGASGVGDLFVRAKKIVSTASNAIQTTGTEVGTRTWIEAESIIGSLVTVTLASNKTYITTQKLDGVGSATSSVVDTRFTSQLWLTAQKVTSNSAAAVPAVRVKNTSTAYLDVAHWEILGSESSGVEIQDTANAYFEGVMHRGTNGDAILATAGTATVRNASISTQVGYFDLNNVGGTLNVFGSKYDRTKVSGAISALGNFVGTTEQLRIGYDASNYYKTTVGSTGLVTLEAVGSGAAFDLNSVTAVKGTITNDAASAGDVGEYVVGTRTSGSALSLTTDTVADIATISLTAGDWDISGNITFAGTTATVTGSGGGIQNASAVMPTSTNVVYSGTQTVLATFNDSIFVTKRFSLASTTTIYLVARATFTAGTVTGYGAIAARRVR